MNVYKLNADARQGWACVGGMKIGEDPVSLSDRGKVFDQLCAVEVSDFLDPATRGMRKPGRLADCMGYEYSSPILCFSEAADRALETCRQYLKRVPAIFRGVPHILTEVQVAPGTADLARSMGTRLPDGGMVAVERCFFNAAVVRPLSIFRADIHGSPVYVTDRFIALVRKARLTGFAFTMEWTEGTGIVDPHVVDYERKRITGVESDLPSWATYIDTIKVG